MQVNVRSLTAHERSLLLPSEDCAYCVSVFVCVCVIAANTFSHQDIPFTKTCLSTWPPNICEVSCILMKISQLQPDPGLYTLEKNTQAPDETLACQTARLTTTQSCLSVDSASSTATPQAHKLLLMLVGQFRIYSPGFWGFWKYKVCLGVCLGA